MAPANSAWASWCKAEGADAGAQTAFSMRCTRGFDSYRSNDMRWKGIGPVVEDAG